MGDILSIGVIVSHLLKEVFWILCRWMMVCWGKERIVSRWGMVRFWAYFEDGINRWGAEYAKEDSRIGQALGLSLWKDGIGIDRLWVKTIGRQIGRVNVGVLMMTDMPVQHPGIQERHLDHRCTFRSCYCKMVFKTKGWVGSPWRRV